MLGGNRRVFWHSKSKEICKQLLQHTCVPITHVYRSTCTHLSTLIIVEERNCKACVTSHSKFWQKVCHEPFPFSFLSPCETVFSISGHWTKENDLCSSLGKNIFSAKLSICVIFSTYKNPTKHFKNLCRPTP